MTGIQITGKRYNSDGGYAIMEECKDLINALLRHAPEDGNFTYPIEGFWIVRRNKPNNIIERCMVKPVILVSVQGKKRSVIGGVPYEYEAGQSLLLGMYLPADSTVLDASPEKPYCSMILGLDASLITQIIAKLPEEKIDKEKSLAIACSKTDPAVLEAFIRLVELLDTPEHIQYIAPLIIREIHYRLLTGPLGRHILATYTLGTQSNQIARAITWLENNYKTPLKIEVLAKHVNMSVSTFHRNFKMITSLSPLQFQKQLRLFEAQRLMLTEGKDVIAASYEVGYESHTQFNREYKRMFGNPPAKDVKYILAKAS